MGVMNVQRSTHAYAKGDLSPHDSGGPAQLTMAAGQMEKNFGDENVGDVLNKISDPNYVNAEKKARSTGKNQLDKDAFLKLMLTQMKYQDPTKPMESNEMAAQLAQFTSLEQLNNIHGTLESMKNQQNPQSNYQALALIGKRVSGDSSKLVRAAGDTKQSVGFELMGDAATVRVTVKDSGGNLVRKLDMTDMKKGRNVVEWNGIKDDGQSARPGEYKIAIEGVSKTGQKIFAKTEFGGKITGLNYTPEGPVLLVGNQSIRMSDVKKIEDGRDEPPAPKATQATPLEVGAKAPTAMPGLPPGTMQGVPPGMEAMMNQALTAQGFTLAPPTGAAPATPTSPLASATNTAPKAAAIAPPPAEHAPAAVASPAVASDENLEPATDIDPAMIGNIDKVPMSSELLNKIASAK